MRRSGSRFALLAAVVMLATLAVAPVAAQTAASITVTPNCDDPGSRNVRVSGAGFEPGRRIDIYFDGVQRGETLTDNFGRFVRDISITAARGYHRVEAVQTGTPIFATATYRAPCGLAPRLVLNPPCGPRARTQLTIEAFDMPANSDVRRTFDVGGKPEENGGLGTDDSGYVTETFFISPAESRDYVVAVDDYGVYGVTARATYQVPCPPPTTTSPSTTAETTTTEEEATTSTTSRGTTTVPTTTTSTTIPPPTPGATLTVTPGVGPGGLVVRARGTGFPPGPVSLTWAPGIGITQAVAGPDGTFEAQVLVMPNDILGPRSLVATGGATTANARFVVVPDTMQPSGREVAQIVRAHRFLFR